jgi:hypothetical protein
MLILGLGFGSKLPFHALSVRLTTLNMGTGTFAKYVNSDRLGLTDQIPTQSSWRPASTVSQFFGCEMQLVLHRG